jgi:hypothetical protein
MTVSELIGWLEECPGDAHVLVGGMAGPLEVVLGFPESGSPNKVILTSDPERD